MKRFHKSGFLEIILGLIFILFAVGLTTYNMAESNNAARNSRAALIQIIDELGDSIVQGQAIDPNAQMPIKMIDGLGYDAIITMPTIELELPVLANYVYEDLQYAPCHYSGSIYKRNMVICAHNYYAHFGKIGNLSPGDEVTLTDMNGHVFTYKVKEILTIRPTEIDEFVNNGYDLTLFTCTLDARERVIVRCTMVNRLI